jgi:hypothetical protein
MSIPPRTTDYSSRRRVVSACTGLRARRRRTTRDQVFATSPGFSSGAGPWPERASVIPYASVEMRRAPSLAGNRKVPVHMSPCQSEMTMVESTPCVEMPILRTGLRVSWNQVRSPYTWPSTGTTRLWHRSPSVATGIARRVPDLQRHRRRPAARRAPRWAHHKYVVVMWAGARLRDMTDLADPKTTLHRYLQAARDALVGRLNGLSEREARLPRTPTGNSLLGVLKHCLNVEVGYFGPRSDVRSRRPASWSRKRPSRTTPG